jgi:hypothetical protein
MEKVTGESKGTVSTADFCSPAIGIVLVTGVDRSRRISQLMDAAKLIFRVEECSRAVHKAIEVQSLGDDRSSSVSFLAYLQSTP